MAPMTDDEVFAAIDRGMRRVWARFPHLPTPPSPADAEARPSIPPSGEVSDKAANPEAG